MPTLPPAPSIRRGIVTAADQPPNRRHLAAMLKVFARSPGHFGIPARRELLAYIDLAEDTIEAQATMLRADLTELTNHRRGRAEDAETNAALRGIRDRLCADAAALRTLARAALLASGVCEADAAETIRRALEHTP